jgi:hypothetical protein
MEDDGYERELQRRLTVIEDPLYDDPARHDLPRLDVAMLLLGTLVLVGLMWMWGAPA